MKYRQTLRSSQHSPPRRSIHLILLAFLLGTMFSFGTERVSASEATSDTEKDVAFIHAVGTGPQRKVVEQHYGKVHLWVVRAWADQIIKCELYLSDDTFPDKDDIRLGCGDQVASEWEATPPCEAAADPKKLSSCDGLYLVDLGKKEQFYNAVVELPVAEAHFDLINCASGKWCSEPPLINFFGVEPLEGENIQAIKVRSGKKLATCNNASTCSVRVPTTTQRGIWIEYWAESSFGDKSEHQFLYLRNVYRASDASQYFFEVLSPRYTSDAAELQWSSFPALDHPNAEFYSSVDAENSLLTGHHLYYLSGKLINGGKVDTSECSTAVLLSNGTAGACGVEAAHATVVEWQNRYNQNILRASQAYGLPANILKGILAQESQFWPDPQVPYEYGLGSLTENGIDALLVTDLDSFLQVCLPILGKKDCVSGYAALTAEKQAKLRGAVLRAVGTDRELDLIARVLMSQVVQVGQVVQNATNGLPGQAASYEDLWDLTIASYHAGIGCVSEGVQNLRSTKQPITFEHFCGVASKGCQSACAYTDKVKGYAGEGNEEKDESQY